MTETVVKMSAKGQLVVPDEIRAEEGFKPGDRFISVPVKEGVLFKRIISVPDIRAEFKKLSTELEERFKKEKIPRKAVKEAVQWARNVSS